MQKVIHNYLTSFVYRAKVNMAKGDLPRFFAGFKKATRIDECLAIPLLPHLLTGSEGRLKSVADFQFGTEATKTH